MPSRYDLLYSLALPLVLPWAAWRATTRGKYRQSLPAMLGRRLPPPGERQAFAGGSVWMHAVSVGECAAAKALAPLVRELEPERPLVVSTITETGQAQARRLLTEAAEVHYFPLDFSPIVGRFLDCYQPSHVLLMETELWPNFLTMSRARGARVFLANGKLSEKSYRGYLRHRRLLRPAFDAIRAFCMQTEADAERMARLSGRPGDVHVTGNVKFDQKPALLSPEAAEGLRAQYRLGPPRPTLVVGSTHPGEEQIVLDAFARLRRDFPDLLLLLSPRHPERFVEVGELCRARPEGWSLSRATHPAVESPDIFLLDTMGELARCYGLGQVAVVAGSFGPVGGHNLLEAAHHALPVVVGPNMRAQREIDRLFRAQDSGCLRSSAEGLGEDLAALFADQARRRRLGEQARATALLNQGAARRSIDILRRYWRERPQGDLP